MKRRKVIELPNEIFLDCPEWDAIPYYPYEGFREAEKYLLIKPIRYIREDVVITAINEGLSIIDYDTEGRAESILNKAIDNADED
jgi:hypothetical protein